MTALATDAEVLRFALSPAVPLERAGFALDEWQAVALSTSRRRLFVLGSRQIGKGVVGSARATWVAIHEAPAVVLLVGAAERQAQQMLATVDDLLAWCPAPPVVTHRSRTRIALANGSEIHALPSASANAIRGFSPRCVVLDEAGFTDAELFGVLSPMFASRPGAWWLILTSPSYTGHWSHGLWLDDGPGSPWLRLEVPATDCPRIPPEHLAAERRALPESTYLREYCCQWLGRAGGVYDPDDVRRALAPSGTVDAPDDDPMRHAGELGTWEQRREARARARKEA